MNLQTRLRFYAVRGYILIIFVMLPLFFMNMYFNISTEKWLFFTVATVVFAFLVLVLRICDTSKEKYFFSEFGFSEYAMLFLLFANVVSFVCSVNPRDSLWGFNARHHGFFNFLLYALIYYIIRYYNCRLSLFTRVLAVTGGICSAVAVAQFLSYDPLGMYRGVTVASAHRMISTIGNMNIFAGFLCLTAPLTLWLFLSAKKLWHMLVFGVILALSFAAAIGGNSDSFYLGFAAGFIIMIIAGGMSRREFLRLPAAVSIITGGDYLVVTAANHIEKEGIILSRSFKDLGFAIRPVQGIGRKLLDSPNTLLTVCIICIIIGLALIPLAKKEGAEKKLIPAKASNILLIAALIFTVGLFLYAVISFPFDENFGSFRGFIWNLSINDFKGLTPGRKLFGYGQETLLNIYKMNYRDKMIAVTGVIYDNVHCEYLEYMITTGIFGLACYLTYLGSVLKKILGTVRRDPEAYTLLIPIVAYMAQATVSIAQSTTTPIFFILLAMASGHSQAGLPSPSEVSLFSNSSSDTGLAKK